MGFICQTETEVLEVVEKAQEYIIEHFREPNQALAWKNEAFPEDGAYEKHPVDAFSERASWRAG